MGNTLTKSQVDRLGEKLRAGPTTDADLRELDGYRHQFGRAYGQVIQLVRDTSSLSPTGRPSKSTKSIIDKLRRESIRLSQMQDIAGCRVVVADSIVQDEVAKKVCDSLGTATISDRRAQPSHGYRAVHIIGIVDGYPVEVQIRTELQHLWAEVSEKLSDVVDPAIKYGGGNRTINGLLVDSSELVAEVESGERHVHETYLMLSEGIAELTPLIEANEQLLRTLEKQWVGMGEKGRELGARVSKARDSVSKDRKRLYGLEHDSALRHDAILERRKAIREVLIRLTSESILRGAQVLASQNGSGSDAVSD